MARNRWLKWWPVLLVVVLIVGGVLISRKVHSTSTSAADDLTQIYTVKRGNLVASISPTGEVYAPRQADLSFDVSKIELIELNVTPGQKVAEGDVLARIDTTTLERAVLQAEADLTVAQDNLEKTLTPYSELDLIQARLTVSQTEIALVEANNNLETLLNPDLTSAYTAVQDAGASLEIAKEQLTVTENSTENAAKIRTLENERDWYRNNYWQAQQKFEKGDIDQGKLDWEYLNLQAAEERLLVAQTNADISLASARNKVTQAENTLQDAQENLTELKSPDPVKQRQAEVQVTQAEYNLAKASETLTEVEAGPDPKEIELAQAKVVSAQATLEEAQAALTAATMVAPFDGTVISVGAELGDLVSSNIVVVALTDLTNLRVLAIVDETDISLVEIGYKAEITFDAFPGYNFSGQVLEVPLQGNLVQNVLTYEVPVSLEGAEDVALKPGMTANVSIVVGERQDVLLVPAMAVQQGETGNVVLVQDTLTGPGVATPVQVGLSDGIYVEVKSGLIEGDRVLVEYQAVQNQFGGFNMGFGVPGEMRVMRQP